MSEIESLICIEHLGKNYISKSNEIKALEDINLSINEGEIYGIIGLSGAGKSTLVRCINFLEKPTSGEVIFDGRKLSDLSNKDLRKVRQSMGMIFQQFNLLMQRTVLYNVCFPMQIAGFSKKETKDRALELLEIVGLEDKARAYPAQLSGGQKQRVAIARALATNPKVLLCDEATSALDPTTTQSILALLKDINRKMGLTVVIITHEMSVVESICNRVAIIDQSRVAEVGKVADIFAAPGSDIGRRLVFSGSVGSKPLIKEGNIYRIIFDGQSSYEPVIANLVLECKAAINILFADTKDIEGKAVGEMLIQLPNEEIIVQRVINYMKPKNIRFEEVSTDV